MYVLNFQKQFIPSIESGAKKQTIRPIRKDNRQPKVGDILRLYTGMRTKVCRRIADVVCTEIFPIRISQEGIIVIPGRLVYLNRFAELDGFKSWEEMLEWFSKTHGLPFEWLLIRWDNIKYYERQ